MLLHLAQNRNPVSFTASLRTEAAGRRALWHPFYGRKYKKVLVIAEDLPDTVSGGKRNGDSIFVGQL